MDEWLKTTLLIVGPVVAVGSAVIAWVQARVARGALKQAQLIHLFQGFDAASQTTLQHPDLLYEVHGLDRSIPSQEARAIAYLSVLLDGFQHFYGQEYNGDYTKLVEAMREHSTFLNRILGVAANRKRWPRLKELYYGEFDRGFVDAVESIMVDEYVAEKSR